SDKYNCCRFILLHFLKCSTVPTLSAPLGSSVLLPCTFTTSSHTVVEWKHTAGGNLLRLMPNGQVTFLLPRGGRVKVFPNQSSRGNYSVRIDELLTSDLGCYCCVMGEMSNSKISHRSVIKPRDDMTSPLVSDSLTSSSSHVHRVIQQIEKRKSSLLW
uniref:Ig-like domain-containing protein n=1 Tax=Cynoglossus semilaevis TaxID=244447 RepID=A0A3P8VQU6_CYNSE